MQPGLIFLESLVDFCALFSSGPSRRSNAEVDSRFPVVVGEGEFNGGWTGVHVEILYRPVVPSRCVGFTECQKLGSDRV